MIATAVVLVIFGAGCLAAVTMLHNERAAHAATRQAHAAESKILRDRLTDAQNRAASERYGAACFQEIGRNWERRARIAEAQLAIVQDHQVLPTLVKAVAA